MVIHAHVQVVGKPADHFRVKRFTGTADHAQLAFPFVGHFFASGDHHAEHRGRTGQVVDLVFFGDGQAAVEVKNAVHRQHRHSHRHGAGNAEIQAVGPAGVGHVPEDRKSTRLNS